MRNYLFSLIGVLFCVFYPLFTLWAVRYSAAYKYQQLLQLYHVEAESVISFYEDHLDVHYMQDGSDVTVAYRRLQKCLKQKTSIFDAVHSYWFLARKTGL